MTLLKGSLNVNFGSSIIPWYFILPSVATEFKKDSEDIVKDAVKLEEDNET